MKISESIKNIADLEKKVKKEQKIMIFVETVFSIVLIIVYVFLFKSKNFRINWLFYGILALISFFLFSLILFNEYKLYKSLKKLKEQENLIQDDENFDI